MVNKNITIGNDPNNKRFNENFIQDQFSNPFHFYLMNEEKTDITLTSVISKNDIDINVSSGHGFTVGKIIVIYENSIYLQQKISAVNGDTVTVEYPIGNSFTTDATVIRGEMDLNKNASSSDLTYMYYPRNSSIPIDIKFVKLTMINSSEPDDSKFGNLAALTKGIYFRKENNSITNYGNYKKNQDFDEFGFEVEYSDKAGGGAYSTTIYLDIKQVYGVVIRIFPENSDRLYCVIRDDLSSLTQFHVALIGQFTEGEV